MLKKHLRKLALQKHLSLEEMQEVAGKILIADPLEAAVFLALLSAKGPTAEEIVVFAQMLRGLAKTVSLDRPFVDIVGTGGDGAGTVNISTASALLAAASGVPVIKHGNRGATSACGTADLLEAFGAELNLEPAHIQELLQKTQFAFCFVLNFHPALKKLKSVKQGLSFPTLLNLIGPLIHPAGIDHLLLGVYSEDLVPTMARALQLLGTKRSLVFSNHGLDELSCIGPCKALLVTQDAIEPVQIDPEKLGLSLCTLQDLQGGPAEVNQKIISEALSGKESPISDTLILNAAAAIYLYGPPKSLFDAVAIARKTLQSGSALKLIEDYCRESKQCSPIPVKKRKKSLKAALKGDGVSIIAEIKRASPSKGKIALIPDAGARARLYVDGGASAISVLTNGAFEGSLEDLQNVVEALQKSPVPVLRKDFIRTAEQVIETAEAGADALLLIVAVLKEKTGELLKLAASLGLEALVEVHTAQELEIAVEAGAEIIGVNQRDLSDFSMHPEKFKELAPLLPKSIVSVAESGMKSIEEASILGYRAVLMGEALSRSEDPKSLIEEMVGVCAR